jgi:X-X-X-Leu-X-X-Gly heptad repeat protein
VRYLWGAEGGIVFLFKAHGPEAGESEETDWSKEAVDGSAQLQDGAGTEIGTASVFEEVTRPIQMLSHLRALFLAAGDVRGR